MVIIVHVHTHPHTPVTSDAWTWLRCPNICWNWRGRLKFSVVAIATGDCSELIQCCFQNKLLCYQKNGKDLVAIATGENTIQAAWCKTAVLLTATHILQFFPPCATSLSFPPSFQPSHCSFPVPLSPSFPINLTGFQLVICFLSLR